MILPMIRMYTRIISGISAGPGPLAVPAKVVNDPYASGQASNRRDRRLVHGVPIAAPMLAALLRQIGTSSSKRLREDYRTAFQPRLPGDVMSACQRPALAIS
jgi:hypothetical protein